MAGNTAVRRSLDLVLFPETSGKCAAFQKGTEEKGKEGEEESFLLLFFSSDMAVVPRDSPVKPSILL